MTVVAYMRWASPGPTGAGALTVAARGRVVRERSRTMPRGECTCRPGHVQTGTDRFGRRVCSRPSHVPEPLGVKQTRGRMPRRYNRDSPHCKPIPCASVHRAMTASIPIGKTVERKFRWERRASTRSVSR